MSDSNTESNTPHSDYCPHCGMKYSWVEHEGDDTGDETYVCTNCRTTSDGSLLLRDQGETVDFDVDPHQQSVRPRYKYAVKHGNEKQVVLYGAFGWDPLLASVDVVNGNQRSENVG